MKITLLDGNVLSYDQPKKIVEIANDIAVSLGKKCVAGLVNNTHLLRGDHLLIKDAKLEIITDRHDLYKRIISNTASFVVAITLKKLFPNIKLVNNTHYESYNEVGLLFDIEPTIKTDDLQKIEDYANNLINKKSEIKKLLWDENTDVWKKYINKNEYSDKFFQNPKNKHIPLTFYELDGLNLLSPEAIFASLDKIFKVKILEVTGEYLDNDSNNKMIQKIHIVTGQDQKDFENYINEIEEKRSNDHRIIGKQLEIFTINNLIGQGLPIWLPNGTILKQEIKKYLMEKEWEYDFVQVETPVIGTKELYEISGHWEHYRDDMFAPMELSNGETMLLKPMCCPHHIAIYNSKPRSYKELPIRYAEHTLQHRFESSGSLTGLERVRAMELTDCHIFARRNQIKEEFKHCYQLIQDVLETFDIKIDYLSLSLRDPEDKEKYYDDDEMWNSAETELENMLKELGFKYTAMKGEAAFYGPKLDIQAKTMLGHEITVSTIQLDFLLPMRFKLEYINEKGEKETPIMIHRGLIGSYERFISVLLEQTKGVLPLWCTPEQIKIIPVSAEGHLDYSLKLQKMFKENLIRSKIDDRDERLSYKIRDAQVKKIPYQLVIGDQEVKNQTVTFREYGSEEQTTIPVKKFIEQLKEKIKKRSN